MYSAAESEIAGLFICAKSMVQLCQTLIEMGWTHPKSTIQCDNSTAVVVANDTFIQRKTKTINIQYHWLRCCESQGQFQLFWAPCANNLVEYSTKIHPPYFSMKPIDLPIQGNNTHSVHCKGV